MINSDGSGADHERQTTRRGRSISAQRVASSLANGICPREAAFDRFLPQDLRHWSANHWTPLITCIRVAQWLESVGARTVVDIGSGAGKFCVATALAGHCHFTGIEQRPRLVTAARQLARTFDIEDRVRFLQGTLEDGTIPDADAYYFFNPFGENLAAPEGRIDHEVDFSRKRFKREASRAEAFLSRAAVGTFVLEYNGFGGVMPSPYEPIRLDTKLAGYLRMWEKKS
jgi:SAM-dependent methyltransferase